MSRDEMMGIALREVANECTHYGEVDESTLSGCRHCDEIAKNVVDAILMALPNVTPHSNA